MLMSALPQKADMYGAVAYVCFGPEADIVAFPILASSDQKL